MPDSLATRLTNTIRTVPNFPKPGIFFKDITPLLANASLLRETFLAMSAPFVTQHITHVVGIESRGFLFGVPIAQLLRAAFVPARKPGKLPRETASESFALEYGHDALEIHLDAFGTAARVLIVDDILATGGTATAAYRLVERLGGTVIGLSVLGEIRGLKNDALPIGMAVHSLLEF